MAREHYLHILPQIQEILQYNDECDEITISKSCMYLQRKSGVKLYFDFSTANCRAESNLLANGDVESEELNFLASHLKDTEGGTVIDAGSHAGFFSLELYQKRQSKTYYLFEPVPNTFNIMKKTLKLNEISDSKFICYNLGLSDKKGNVTFFVPSAKEAASMVANEDDFYRKQCNRYGEYTGKNDISEIECRIDTLDAVVSRDDIKAVELLKIDVEGNEKAVLEGAKNLLEKERPLVYCELLRLHARRFGYHPNEVIDYMKKLGYTCSVIRGENLHIIKEITDSTKETNFLFF